MMSKMSFFEIKIGGPLNENDHRNVIDTLMFLSFSRRNFWYKVKIDDDIQTQLFFKFYLMLIAKGEMHFVVYAFVDHL